MSSWQYGRPGHIGEHPAPAATVGNSTVPAGRPQEGRRVDRRPTVLLVEDDRADALLVEELVADAAPGLHLRWARTLAEACASLAADPPTAYCWTCIFPMRAVSRRWSGSAR